MIQAFDLITNVVGFLFLIIVLALILIHLPSDISSIKYKMQKFKFRIGSPYLAFPILVILYLRIVEMLILYLIDLIVYAPAEVCLLLNLANDIAYMVVSIKFITNYKRGYDDV